MIEKNPDLWAMLIMDGVFLCLSIVFLLMSDSYMKSINHVKSYEDIAKFYTRSAKLFFWISAFFGILFLIVLWTIATK